MTERVVEAAARRARSGAAFQLSDRHIRNLLEEIPAGIYMCDPAGLITYVNRRAVDLWGRTPKLNDPADRFCGSFRLYSAEGSPVPHDECWMALALRTERGFNRQEIVVERPDGVRHTVLVHANPIHDEAGALLGAVNVVMDITDQKRKSEDLAKGWKELTDFIENAAVGLHWIGPDGVILWANQAELNLLGYSREEYVGHPVAEFHADPAVIKDVLARLLRRETLNNYEARLRCKDGSIRHVLISSNALFRDGQFIHTRCFTRDITDRKRAEDERAALLESERAARNEAERANRMKDEFIATVSHDLRTPLSSILGWAHLLTHSDRPSAEDLSRGLEAIARGARAQAQLWDPLESTCRHASLSIL